MCFKWHCRYTFISSRSINAWNIIEGERPVVSVLKEVLFCTRPITLDSLIEQSTRSPYLFYLLVHSRCRGCFFHSITHRHTPQSVELLWTGDRPVAETSTLQHEGSQETNIHAPGRIQTHDPSKRLAAELRHRPRGHWDRLEIRHI
jgi:hypothetical protein